MGGIKKSLEDDGMGDIAGKIRTGQTQGGGEGKSLRKLGRREGLENTRIFLPKVLWVDEEGPREFDYERDLLSQLDWLALDINVIADSIETNVQSPSSHNLRLGLEVLTQSGRESISPRETEDRLAFDTVHATRTIVDIVGNAWVAREVLHRLMTRLTDRGFSLIALGKASAYILDELRKGLTRFQDLLAEKTFRLHVAAGRIQFRLRTDLLNWEMPFEISTDQPESGKLLFRSKDAKPVGLSLFMPVDERNTTGSRQSLLVLGRRVGYSMVEAERCPMSYGLQGWRKQRDCPDFIFAIQKAGSGDRLIAIETKGDFLGGDDTIYKQQMLELLSSNYRFENVKVQGELELVVDDYTVGVCDLVLEGLENPTPQASSRKRQLRGAALGLVPGRLRRGV